MTGYILLFVLGFCASALLALLVSPAIYRRVVTLTERRMRATVALTSAEVRAEKDAARARFAADNSQLNERLKSERTRRSGLVVERDRLVLELGRAGEEREQLNGTIAALKEEGEGLKKQLDDYRESDARLTNAVAEAEKLGRTKDEYIKELTARAETLAGHLDEARIDVASREARAETLQGRINLLRDERTNLREVAKSADETARDLSLKLEREEKRVRALDEKIAAKVTQLSDAEGALERSLKEIQRLGPSRPDSLPAEDAKKDLSEIEAVRLQLRRTTEQADTARKEAEAKIRELEEELAALKARFDPGQSAVSEFEQARRERARAMSGQSGTNAAINRRIERLRSRHAKLVSSLSEPDGNTDDSQLRDEIAEIAAMMVDLTAAREGPSSPIHKVLAADTAHEGANGTSLAERSRRQIEASAEQDGR